MCFSETTPIRMRAKTCKAMKNAISSVIELFEINTELNWMSKKVVNFSTKFYALALNAYGTGNVISALIS